MKWLGFNISTSPLDASPSLGYSPALNSLVPIYTPEWREELWEYSVLPRNTTQCPRPGLKPGPLDSESSALTVRPLPFLDKKARRLIGVAVTRQQFLLPIKSIATLSPTSPQLKQTTCMWNPTSYMGYFNSVLFFYGDAFYVLQFFNLTYLKPHKLFINCTWALTSFEHPGCLEGERDCSGNMPCPRTHHNDPVTST